MNITLQNEWRKISKYHKNSQSINLTEKFNN